MTDAELLDAALQILVDFELPEMVCDVLSEVDDTCSETCKYDCPTKECWWRFLEVKAKEAHNGAPD